MVGAEIGTTACERCGRQLEVTTRGPVYAVGSDRAYVKVDIEPCDCEAS